MVFWSRFRQQSGSKIFRTFPLGLILAMYLYLSEDSRAIRVSSGKLHPKR